MPIRIRKYRHARKCNLNAHAPAPVPSSDAPSSAPDKPSPSLPGPKVTIDASAFPLIMVTILAAAPYHALLGLRATCRAYKKPAEKRIMRHVLVWPGGWMSSRLAPLSPLPWLNAFEDRERLLQVEILDVHPDASLSHCRWFAPVGDDRRIAGHQIPVVRRWGTIERGDISARIGVAFLDVPPVDGCCDVYLDGCDVRIFHVPHPRRKMVSTRLMPIFPATTSDKIVLRRREYMDTLPASSHAWHGQHDIDDLLPEHIAHLLDPAVNQIHFRQHEIPDPHTEHIVLVDYEGSDYEGRKKVRRRHRGVWPHTGSEWPFDREEMLAYAREYISDGKEDMIDERVTFLTMDEYRESVGADYKYEEDDHRFDFESQVPLDNASQ